MVTIFSYVSQKHFLVRLPRKTWYRYAQHDLYRGLAELSNRAELCSARITHTSSKYTINTLPMTVITKWLVVKRHPNYPQFGNLMFQAWVAILVIHQIFRFLTKKVWKMAFLSDFLNKILCKIHISQGLLCSDCKRATISYNK